VKYGRSIQELAAEIARQQNAKRDLVAATTDIAMMTDDEMRVALNVGDSRFDINEIAHDQIDVYAGIPAKYYDVMLAEQPALLAQNVNTWLKAKGEKRLVRTMDGRARAFLSDRYRPLENYDLAEAILPVLGNLRLELISCEVTERRMYLKAVDKRINRDIPSGRRMGDGSHTIFDTCVPAIVISNSEVGYGQLSVETAIWTKACTNLAVFTQDSMKRRHVGARHEIAAGENIAELLSDDTRRVTDQALWLQVRDVVKAAFDEARFASRCAKIAETSKQKIEGDPVKVIEVTAKRFGITDTERPSVLRHLIEGGDLTRYGLFNAITRTAEDLPDYDRATEFEHIGGNVIELGAHEWKEMAKAA
jgi:hypothetical protein